MPADVPRNDDRFPFYRRATHVGLRFAHGALLALALTGIGGALLTGGWSPSSRDLPGLAILLLYAAFAYATVYRTSEVYGSAAGVQFKRRGAWLCAPWSAVGRPEYTWWSFNRAARVASVDVHTSNGGEETLLFFANDALVADLLRMRDAARRD